MQLHDTVATTSTDSKGREPLLNFVRDWISPDDIGHLKSFDSATAKKEIPRLNSRHAIERSIRLGHKIHSWTESKLTDHRSGERTYYYTSRSDRGLITLDIDCHRTGDVEDALQFARFLKARYFPTMECEVSTSGNGVHAYLKVTWGEKQTNEATAKWLSKRFKRVQTWLNALVHEHGFELDGVEIKGTPTFVGDRGDVIFGQPCRLPRRIEDLANAPQLSIAELTAMARRDQATIQQHREDLREEAIANPTKRTMTRGSAGVSFSPVTASLVADQLTAADHLVDQLEFIVACHKQVVVTAEDVAIFLAIASELTRTMNVDGSMPTARIQAIWESAHRNGIVDRQFHASRFAAIRNALVDYGIVRMVDNRYSHECHGGIAMGVAMRWSIDFVQLDVTQCLATGLDFSSLECVSQQKPSATEHETLLGGKLYITHSAEPAPRKAKEVRLRPQWVRADELRLDRPPIPSLAA